MHVPPDFAEILSSDVIPRHGCPQPGHTSHRPHLNGEGLPQLARPVAPPVCASVKMGGGAAVRFVLPSGSGKHSPHRWGQARWSLPTRRWLRGGGSMQRGSTTETSAAGQAVEAIGGA